MKSPSRIFLILSVALNGCLAMSLFYAFQQNSSRRHESSTSQVPAVNDSISRQAALSAQTEVKLADDRRETIQSTHSPRLESPVDIAKQMRADGYPAVVVDAAIAAAIQLRDRAYRKSLMGSNRVSRVNPNPIISPENLAKLKELEAQQIAEFRAISSYNKHEAVWDARNSHLKYGNLAPQKVQAVRQIEEDYSRLTTAAYQGNGLNPNNPEAQAMVAQEFEKDIRSILTPEEANDYLRYNSPSAKALQSTMGGLDIDETTYGILLEALSEAQSKLRSLENDPTKATAIQSALYERYYETIGADNFTKIMGKLDPLVASVDPVFQAAHLTGDARVELFFDARNGMLKMLAAPEIMQAPAAETLYHSLIGKGALSPEHVEAFNKTPFGAGLLKRAKTKP